MDREPWTPPTDPPVRRPGLPDQPSSKGWDEYQSADKYSFDHVWAWLDGAWEPAVTVRGRGHDASGWWIAYRENGRVGWVHQDRTLPWAPAPGETSNSGAASRQGGGRQQQS